MHHKKEKNLFNVNGENIILALKINNRINYKFDLEAFKSNLNKQLPTHCRVSKLIILDHIPHTSSGKIQRAKIKNWIQKGNFEMDSYQITNNILIF